MVTFSEYIFSANTSNFTRINSIYPRDSIVITIEVVLLFRELECEEYDILRI